MTASSATGFERGRGMRFEPRYKSLLPSGVTPKVLAARSRKAIANIESQIEKLSAPYAEVDNSVEGAVMELSSAFDKFKARILETQKYLEECEP